jgi:hypothetical protein
MDARLVIRRKERLAGGLILEMVVWLLPAPVPGSEHRYKYRLFFGRKVERILGCDNERGKGDHRHLGNNEFPYVFRDVTTLEADFLGDVASHLERER